MKVLLILSALCAIAVATEYTWTDIRPVELLPKFQDRLKALGVPARTVERQQRIVGGDEATPHQFPYQVSLMLNFAGGTGFCGGSVLSNNYVLTAAHCVEADVASATVIFGAHDIRIQEPNQVRMTAPNANFILHPEYDNTLIRNDIAVIRLPSSVTFNAQIQPVSMPTRSQVGEQFFGEIGTISGWGRFSDASNDIAAQLRYVNVGIITNLACRVRFPTIIQDSNICSSGEGGRGACQGDSGGPLTIQRGSNSLQVGVVSFGLAIGCEVGWPSAFARVTSFLDFIQSNTDLTIV